MSPCLRQLAIGLVLSSFTSLTVQAMSYSCSSASGFACSACHSLGQTPDHHIGPPLGGLLNRPAGAVEGYRYSEALRSSGWRWSLPTLLAWLAEPDAAIPNNAMNYVNPLTAEESQRLAEWLLRVQ